MDLRGGEGEVPVAGEGFGRRERGVAVVDCGDCEGDVAAEDYCCEPDWGLLVGVVRWWRLGWLTGESAFDG